VQQKQKTQREFREQDEKRIFFAAFVLFAFFALSFLLFERLTLVACTLVTHEPKFIDGKRLIEAMLFVTPQNDKYVS
jgi:hypothetical protein